MFLILGKANLWPNLKPWNFNMKFFPPDMPTKSIVIFKKNYEWLIKAVADNMEVFASWVLSQN